MRLTCEFDSLEDLFRFAEDFSGLKKPEEKGQSLEGDETDTRENEISPQLPESQPVTEQAFEAEALTCTLVDVRAKLAELQKSGKRDQVKQLLEAFGAKRLSDVPEEKYGELMKKAGEL